MAREDTDRVVRIGVLALLGTVVVVTLLPLLLVIPFALIATPVGFAYQSRAHWRAWEFLNPLAMLLSWGAAVTAFGLSKSMANLIELPVLGLLSAGVLWLRAIEVPRTTIETRRAVALLLALLLGAAAALIVPALPE